jgi:hypothetical protein
MVPDTVTISFPQISISNCPHAVTCPNVVSLIKTVRGVVPIGLLVTTDIWMGLVERVSTGPL